MNGFIRFFQVPAIRSFIVVGLVAALAVLPGCARETDEAGVKPIGVGFDPGDLYPSPEATGGIIDLALVQMRGKNLDLGVTGFFSSIGAFTEPGADSFDSVLGFSYLFSPALVSIDEYQLISPKGPDADLLDLADDTEGTGVGDCLVQLNARGPLGTFRTVDVGERMSFTNGNSDLDLRTDFSLIRNPSDYPVNASSVYIYYIGTGGLTRDHTLLPDNWAFGEDIYMHFDGGVPPQDVPVASIPVPSYSAEPSAVASDQGDPGVYSPSDLTGVTVSNFADHDGARPLRYDPASPDLPDPRTGDQVISLEWDPTPEEDMTEAQLDGSQQKSFITVALKLLGASEQGSLTDNDDSCINAEVLEGDRDEDWLAQYTARKQSWCDPGYEPDIGVGNDEAGLDYLGADTCHDGLDNDGDGTCDEGGCDNGDGEWIPRDPSCARHQYQTSTCGADNLCRSVGGSRDSEDHLGDLICTALDSPGRFVVPSTGIDALLSQVNPELIEGAVLLVGRTTEEAITVPLVRDQIGNQDDINPVRLRASQIQYGRLTWE